MKLEKRFTNSLMGIYNLDILNYFLDFLRGEQAVLFLVYVNGKMPPSEISQKLGITKSRMSSIIKALKNKKMIKILKDETDKRKRLISLSDNGLNFIKNKETEILNIFKIYYKKMGKDEILNLTKLLEKTVEIMKEVKR